VVLAIVAAVIVAASLGQGATVLAAGLSNTKPDIPTGSAPDVPVVNNADEARALGGVLPDVIEEIPQHLQIQNTGQREFLRYSTTHWNFGDGPLEILGGGQVAACVIDGVPYAQCTYATQLIRSAAGDVVAQHPAGVAFFHPEHNHWHQNGVAFFAIRAALGGPPVGPTGYKTTFCLVDVDKYGVTPKSRTYFECNGALQGISVGWGDEYHQSTPGQELDVTGLPSGDYYLTHDADPDQHWVESNEDDNRSWVKFRLSRKGANPEVTILDSNGFQGNTSNA
jgi:hypothetical protein